MYICVPRTVGTYYGRSTSSTVESSTEHLKRLRARAPNGACHRQQNEHAHGAVDGRGRMRRVARPGRSPSPPAPPYRSDDSSVIYIGGGGASTAARVSRVSRSEESPNYRFGCRVGPCGKRSRVHGRVAHGSGHASRAATGKSLCRARGLGGVCRSFSPRGEAEGSPARHVPVARAQHFTN